MSATQSISDEHRRYGELLCHFANAKTTDEAGMIFIESVKKAFNYPSDHYKKFHHNQDYQDEFPALEKFWSKLEILNDRQRALIKDFINTHPSHLHYRYFSHTTTFRGLRKYYEIHNRYEPYILYLEHEPITYENGKLTGHNVGTPGTQAIAGRTKGEYVDDGDGIKSFVSEFEKILDRVCKERKLPETESRIVSEILRYYFEVLEPEHNHISRIQKELRNVLDVLAGIEKFNDAAVSTIEKYEAIQAETNLNVSYIIADDSGGISIEDFPPFDEYAFLNRCDGCVHLCLQDYYDVSIIYCFFKFFRKKSNCDYLKKCRQCGDFFIAKHKTRKLCYPPKKCETDNKNKWQREFMSKKRDKNGPDFDPDYI